MQKKRFFSTLIKRQNFGSNKKNLSKPTKKYQIIKKTVEYKRDKKDENDESDEKIDVSFY